jgi:hypothetical protein
VLSEGAEVGREKGQAGIGGRAGIHSKGKWLLSGGFRGAGYWEMCFKPSAARTTPTAVMSPTLA